jgi:hypothetical protein
MTKHHRTSEWSLSKQYLLRLWCISVAVGLGLQDVVLTICLRTRVDCLTAVVLVGNIH